MISIRWNTVFNTVYKEFHRDGLQHRSDIAMLAVAGAAVGGAIGYATKARAGDAQMIELPAEFDGIWSFDAKKWVYDQWDPEKPRDYDNFNPFERNDESAMCDTNGCFPGQSKGYKSPVRPDQCPGLRAARVLPACYLPIQLQTKLVLGLIYGSCSPIACAFCLEG